jgi:formylmethanofuran dehydrogenase subunit E
MGTLGICAKCRHELIVLPFQKVMEREARLGAAQAEEEQLALAAAAVPIPRDEIFTPGTPGKKRCAQCARRLLEPGGYQVVDGKPYCPDCLTEVQAREATALAPTVGAPLQSREPTQPTCDACERPLAAADAALIEGFSLCRPCVRVDVETALSLARARHKARLRRLHDELSR